MGTAIISCHGVAMQCEDLQCNNINYLETVRNKVQAVVDDALILEQTVQRTAIPEFSGCTLFGWVYPGLNMLAAYRLSPIAN